MSSFSITLTDSEVEALLGRLPQSIFRARQSAIAKTTTFAKRRLQQRMEAATGIRKTVFTRFRVKSKRKRDSGIIWFGYRDVKAGYVGKLAQDPAGAFAGEYFLRADSLSAWHPAIAAFLNETALKKS